MNGVIQGSMSGGYGGFRIVWWESNQDHINNRSTVNISVQIYCPISWNYESNQTCTTSIDGSQATITLPSWGYYDSYTEIARRTMSVYHSFNDSTIGQKSCQISASFNTGTGMGTATASGSAQLDTLKYKSKCKTPSTFNYSADPILSNSNFVTPNSSITLTWSNAQAGNSNNIVGYDVYYKIDTDANSFPTISNYDYIKSISSSSTSGSVAIDLSEISRSSYINFGIRVRGSAGESYYSDIKTITGVKINQLPTIPIVEYPIEVTSSTEFTRLTSLRASDNDTGQSITYILKHNGTIVPNINSASSVLNYDFAISGNTSHIYTLESYDGLECCESPQIIEIKYNENPIIYSATMDATTYVSNNVTNKTFASKMIPSLSVSESGQATYILHYGIKDNNDYIEQEPLIVLQEYITDLSSSLSEIDLNDIFKNIYNQQEIRYQYQIIYTDNLGETTHEIVYCGVNGKSNSPDGAGYWYISEAPQFVIDYNKFEMSNRPNTRPNTQPTSFYKEVRLIFKRDSDIINYTTNIVQTINETGEKKSLSHTVEKIVQYTNNNEDFVYIDITINDDIEPTTSTEFIINGFNGSFNKEIRRTLTSAFRPLVENFSIGGASHQVHIKPFTESHNQELISATAWPFPVSDTFDEGLTTYETSSDKLGLILSRSYNGIEYTAYRPFNVKYTYVIFEDPLESAIVDVYEYVNGEYIKSNDTTRQTGKNYYIRDTQRRSDILYGTNPRDSIFNFNYIQYNPQPNTFDTTKEYYEFNNIFTLTTDTTPVSSKIYYYKISFDEQNMLGITDYYGTYNINVQFYITNNYGITYYSNRTPLILDFNEDILFSNDTTMNLEYTTSYTTENNYQSLGNNAIQEGLLIQAKDTIQIYTNEDIAIDLLISRNSGDDWLIYKTYTYLKNNLAYGQANQTPATISFDNIDNHDGNPLPFKFGKIGEIMTSIDRQFKLRARSLTRGVNLGESLIKVGVPVIRHTTPNIILNSLKLNQDYTQFNINYTVQTLGFDENHSHQRNCEAKLQLRSNGEIEPTYINATGVLDLSHVPFINKQETATSLLSDNDWMAQAFCIYFKSTIADGLMGSVTKEYRTNIKLLYNTTPTIAYRANQLGINASQNIIDVHNDGILIINQSTDKNHIYILGKDSTINDTLLDYDTYNGVLNFYGTKNGKSISRQIDLLKGTLNNFIIDGGIIDG